MNTQKKQEKEEQKNKSPSVFDCTKSNYSFEEDMYTHHSYTA